jgi:YesN/AraC family two-component response regulator
LLTDVKMPGISGFDLARQAKVMRPALHVIYLSGHVAQFDRKGPTYGRLMQKPLRAADLLAAISSEFQGASGPPAQL